MQEIKGQYNRALVFTDALEATAAEQIRTLCDQPFAAGSKIRIMSDVHAGAGCTIGTTMTVDDKAVPNLVGVDIGCGIETTELEARRIDFSRLDDLIRKRIPSGFSIRKKALPEARSFPLEALRCRKKAGLDLERERRALGSLGGGNHFIEIDRADDGTLFLLVHSGSRHLGKAAADYYQKAAVRQLREKVPKALAYCEGALFDDYIHDMKRIQDFAALNRQLMTQIILDGMGLRPVRQFTTIHNYIDTEQMILRKGAVSAQKDELLLIPLNMRDGAWILRGKGNPEWNFSAPHGAGRSCSRREARRIFSLKDYEKSMEGIYSTSVSRATLDECPMAYKPAAAIRDVIGETAEIRAHIKPVYNFKAE